MLTRSAETNGVAFFMGELIGLSATQIFFFFFFGSFELSVSMSVL